MGSVRQSSGVGGHRRLAHLAPGEIVWASVVNGIENPSARGKTRPVILVEPVGWAWRTMGLTTRSRHHDGRSRTPIPNPHAVGLTASGWLWSDRLVVVSGIDIHDHIGWIDVALAQEVIALARVSGATGDALLRTARGHAPEAHTLPAVARGRTAR